MSGKNQKLIISISIFLFLFTSLSFSQHQITLKPTIGGYIYNSENSLKIMENEDYVLNYGIEVSYENKDIFGYDIQLDYSYIYSGFDNYLEWVRTGESDPTPIGYSYSDIWLSLNNFDFELKNELNENFSYGFGPSFSFVNRTFSDNYTGFVDRLASFAIGVNVSIDFKYPLNESEQYLFIFSSVKYRYLFGLLYDKGLRDLSDYDQHFFTGNFSIGLGYRF
jgi:hypothetical protein